MVHAPLTIDDDIRRAEPPPTALYDDALWWQRIKRGLLQRTWHVVGPASAPPSAGTVCPQTLLPGALDEPLLQVVDAAMAAHLLSNVCPRCGAVLVSRECAEQVHIECTAQRCSARFALDGSAEASGERLPAIPVGLWGPMRFASIRPAQSFDVATRGLRHHLATVPLADAGPSPDRSRDFSVRAHWLHYIEHALTETWGDTQTQDLSLEADGVLRSERLHDAGGTRYRWWLFPTTLVDADATGLRIRSVDPLGPTSTRVVMHCFAWGDAEPNRDESEFDTMHYAAEAQIERRARGRRSYFGRRTRYNVDTEVAVHHCHRLIASLLSSA